ncbi:MAG: protein kinase [Myxococcaceae bacterium]|nr:protein kinase [Myxococcaceae bacterium]
MTCPSENSLLDYLEGRLASQEDARLGEHLEGCERCREVASLASQIHETMVGDSTLSTSPTAIRQAYQARAQAAAELIGQRIGEYEVEALIGCGGMGLVYRAVHPVIQKPVAIKVLRPELAADPTHMRRMVSEARAVTSIGHRGVVDIFSFGELADGRQYLVMEFLVGRALDRIVREQAPLPLGPLLVLLDGILEALGAAHAAGVVHRDLKPSNLFVVEPPHGSPYVKLLDFGLARRERTNTGHTRIGLDVIGTPAYMAPEQVKAQPVTTRADLYALGVVAFELAAGKRPFDGPTVQALLQAHVNEQPPRLSSLVAGVPPALDGLIARLLEKDPAARPASVTEVQEELRRISQIDEVTARRPPDEPARRTWTWVLLGVGLVSALLLGAAVQRFATADELQVTPPRRPSLVPVVVPDEVVVDAGEEPTRGEEDAGLEPARVPQPLKVQVRRHLQQLQARLKQRTPAGEPPNALVTAVLRETEGKLASARTDAQLRAIDASLSDLERKYLPRR